VKPAGHVVDVLGITVNVVVFALDTVFPFPRLATETPYLPVVKLGGTMICIVVPSEDTEFGESVMEGTPLPLKITAVVPLTKPEP